MATNYDTKSEGVPCLHLKGRIETEKDIRRATQYDQSKQRSEDGYRVTFYFPRVSDDDMAMLMKLAVSERTLVDMYVDPTAILSDQFVTAVKDGARYRKRDKDLFLSVLPRLPVDGVKLEDDFKPDQLAALLCWYERPDCNSAELVSLATAIPEDRIKGWLNEDKFARYFDALMVARVKSLRDVYVSFLIGKARSGELGDADKRTINVLLKIDELMTQTESVKENAIDAAGVEANMRTMPIEEQERIAMMLSDRVAKRKQEISAA